MILTGKLVAYRRVLNATYQQWVDHNAFRLAAALSYYTVFSLGPLLILATSAAGLLLGEKAAQGELALQMRGLLGTTGAEAVEAMIAAARQTSSGIFASINELSQSRRTLPHQKCLSHPPPAGPGKQKC